MAIIVKGGGGKPEEEKTVTAGTSVIAVNPSSGKVMKKVTVNPTPTESKSVTPTTSELTVTPSEGKHLSQVVVGAVEDVTPEVNAQTPVITQILEGLVGKAQGANATADKILEGYSAYVGQELVHGTAKDASTMVDLLAELGLTKMAIDKVTYSSNTSTSNVEINHSLGAVPVIAIFTSNLKAPNASSTNMVRFAFTFNCAPISEGYKGGSKIGFVGYYSNGYQVAPNSSAVLSVSDSSKVEFTYSSNTYFQAGVEYTLITMA